MLKKTSITLLQQVFQAIGPKKVIQLATESGFIQRHRSLHPFAFLMVLFECKGDFINPSLFKLCALFMKQNVFLSRAGLNQRFDASMADFLQLLFIELFQTQYQLEFPSLSSSFAIPFQRIRVIDATTIALPSTLQADFPGTGQAGVKIQYELDLLTGKLVWVEVQAAKESDTPVGLQRTRNVQENDLCIQDLGYFQYEIFRQIHQAEGYVISRVRLDSTIAIESAHLRYHPDGRIIESSRYEKLDLQALLPTIQRGSYVDLACVYLGRKERYPTRLIIYHHDEEQEQKRQKKIRRRAQRSGKTPKEKVTALAGISLFMTNLPMTVSAEQVCDLYRLRWQIELHFKAWKSFLQLEGTKQKAVKKDRWLAHIYGELFVMLVSQIIMGQMRYSIWRVKGKELSELNAIRIIAEQLAQFYQAFQQDRHTWQALLHVYCQELSRNATKSPRKGSTLPLEKLKNYQSSQ